MLIFVKPLSSSSNYGESRDPDREKRVSNWSGAICSKGIFMEIMTPRSWRKDAPEIARHPKVYIAVGLIIS